MITVTREQALNKFKLVSPGLQDALFSDMHAATIDQIGTGYGFEDAQISSIAQVSGLVLLGFIPPSAVAAEIKERLQIAEDIAQKIAARLNEKIFSLYENELGGRATAQPQSPFVDISLPKAPSATPAATPTPPQPFSVQEIELPPVAPRSNMPPPPPAPRPPSPAMPATPPRPTGTPLAATPPAPVFLHREQGSAPIATDKGGEIDLAVGKVRFKEQQLGGSGVRPAAAPPPPKRAEIELGKGPLANKPAAAETHRIEIPPPQIFSYRTPSAPKETPPSKPAAMPLITETMTTNEPTPPPTVEPIRESLPAELPEEDATEKSSGGMFRTLLHQVFPINKAARSRRQRVSKLLASLEAKEGDSVEVSPDAPPAKVVNYSDAPPKPAPTAETKEKDSAPTPPPVPLK